MESFFSRFKNAFVLILILLVQTIALATQIHRPEDAAHPDGRSVRLLRLWALSVITPFERAFTGSGHGVRTIWTNYVALRGVRQQNQQLQHEVADLRLQRAALAEDALQGQRLQQLLNFQQHYVAKTVAAEVIGTSGSDAGRLLILNKGASDGLAPEMPVITPDGVVGKLRDVGSHTSQLLLLSDPSSGAGVTLASTRIRAVVRGTAAGKLQIQNLTEDSRIQPGEKVLTSGGDQVFPRGLPIGTIESIAPDPQRPPYTAITLKPAANLNRLDEVLVVTGTGPALDPQTQAELAAEAGTHAADLSAERLPNLHPDQPETPADPAGTAPLKPAPGQNAKEAAPRPKPVQHPDRYSPNSVPPADQLVPGARSAPIPIAPEPAATPQGPQA